jgi:hypothetical protein
VRESNSSKLRSWLGPTVRVVIDRPLRSRHPEHGYVDETSCDHVVGAIAPDETLGGTTAS